MDAKAKQTNGKVEPLHRVLRGDVPRLAKSLEACGSEAFCAFSVVMTMLDWWEKNEAYRCTILAPEGGEDLGVCVLIMEQHKQKRLVLYAPEGETRRFLKCMEETNLIPWDLVTVVARVVKRLSDPVDKLLEAKGYKINADSWKTYVMMMSPQDALALEEPKLPDNISLRALTEDDSPFVAKNWVDIIDAESITRDNIKYNGGIGAVDKDGNLVGWTTWNAWGNIGQLFVFPSHRRLNLGSIVTIRMSKEIAKTGRIVAAEVVTDNNASLNLFKRLGFHSEKVISYREISHAQ